MGNLIGYSPWSDAANVGEGIGNSFGRLALQIPQLRLQKQQLELQRQQLVHDGARSQAQAGLYGAETELTKEKNRGEVLKNEEFGKRTKRGTDMSHALGLWTQKMMRGEQPDESDIQMVTAGVADMAKNDPNKLAMFVRNMVLNQTSGIGTDKQTAIGVMQPQLARGLVIPKDGTAVNPVNGTVLAQGAQHLRPGEATINATQFAPGIQAPPMTIAATNPSLPQQFNLGNIIPSLLKRDEMADEGDKIFSREDLSAMGKKVSNFLRGDINKGKPAGTNNVVSIPVGEVLVIDPQGRKGSIPESQLQEAMSKGYRRAN